ncbi:MAG: hypothetical protein ACK502_06180 [Alphaproteobacteria bacterium]
MTQDNQKKCGASEGFDYCFWAKVCVAIPVFPMVAIAAASQFDTPMSQSVAAVLAVFTTIALSRWFDRIPAFQKKINFKK